MAKVLSISSQVVWGPVGNTAAVPVLQACGHEVLQVPTILLSHHPGHGRPAAQRTDAAFLAALLESVAGKGGLSDCDGVLTGYFASAEQVVMVARVIANLQQENPALLVLVDPVMGDGGSLYVAEEIATAIRDQLVPLASILTPNVFELSWLAGEPVTDEETAQDAARRVGSPEILVTSLPVDDHHLGTLLVHGHHATLSTAQKLLRVPHGTGDFLAGAYLGERLLTPPANAFPAAMARLNRAIAASAGQSWLKTN